MSAREQTQVLTAVAGAGWDARLVKALETAPGRIVVARRCVDLADLMATAGAGLGHAVLLSADMRRLDREAISNLRRYKIAVVGVLAPGTASSADERLAQLGVRHFAPVDAEPGELADVILEAVADAETGIEDTFRSRPALRSGGDEDATARDVAAASDADALEFVESGGQQGQLIAVWGPCGAPGRTTVAVNLAMECALLGQSTMLADADTYGASVAQVLGLLDEAPGLAGAARLANNGQLDPISLARYARRVTTSLHVLTGVSRTARWTELRPSALDVVWQQTRSVATVTVVDCGFCLEEDEAISFDSAAPRRNGATLDTLRAADVVVAVGAGDPVGLGRLVRGLADLGEAVPDVVVDVVVNRVRQSTAGADPERQIAEALNRYASVQPVAFVPDDAPTFDSALTAGQTLAEAAPRSQPRQAMAGLSRQLLGLQVTAPRRGLARLRRS